MAEAAFTHAIEDIGSRKLQLRIAGVLNEDVNLGVLMDEIVRLKNDYDLLSIDAAEVSFINSCGVREWIIFLEQAQKLIKIEFGSVGRAFMEQAGVVPNMLGRTGTKVVEFEVPYYCNKCESQYSATLELHDLETKNNKYYSPEVRCQTCDSVLEFDGFEEEYFMVFGE